MTLPAASAFTGGSITEAQFKTAITELRAYLAALLGTDETNKVAALTALGALMNSGLAKTGAYTVVAADRGRVIRCDGTFTLSLTAAATLGDGFAFAVMNEGTGTITIDPNGSEQIDGAGTKALGAGKLAIVYCNGASFTTVGSIATGSGSGLDADLLDGQHGSYYAPASGGAYVAKDCGHSNVGSFVFAVRVGAGVLLTAGSTYNGADLRAAAVVNGGFVEYAASGLPGTWRALGSTSSSTTDPATLFQRIS